jgi:hypothetical protein
MTTQDRFDRTLPAVLDELYPAAMPDYRDDIFRATAATRQRPAWTFLERSLPVDITLARTPGPRFPWRTVGAVAAALLVLAGLIVAAVVGSRPRLPDALGPARNGLITYGVDGDIYVRPALDAAPEVLIGEGDDSTPWFTADGTRLLFERSIDGRSYLMTALADGSQIRQLVDDPLVSPSLAGSADGSSVALINSIKGVSRLFVVRVDGSAPTKEIELGDILPLTVTFRSPDATELLLRGRTAGDAVDMYLVAADGSRIEPLGLPSRPGFGAEFNNSGPSWSPAGSVIAYNAVDVRSGVTNFRVHLLDPDGTNDRPLPGPSDPNTMEGWPNWSPDGSHILVHRWTWQPGGEGWLAVMPADGSAPAREVGPRILGGEETGLIAVWSPDGSRVLMRAENTRQVFSIDPATGDYVELPWNAEGLPEWQRLAR